MFQSERERHVSSAPDDLSESPLEVCFSLFVLLGSCMRNNQGNFILFTKPGQMFGKSGQ